MARLLTLLKLCFLVLLITSFMSAQNPSSVTIAWSCNRNWGAQGTGSLTARIPICPTTQSTMSGKAPSPFPLETMSTRPPSTIVGTSITVSMPNSTGQTSL